MNTPMGILEKLRPTPRWKHADPSVRAAAVYEIGPEEADALTADVGGWHTPLGGGAQ